MNKNLNMYVCGKYHYHNYIKYIDQLGILNNFYYSHRISTDHNTLGIKKEHCKNFILKEYLAHLHLKIFDDKYFLEMLPLYQDLWSCNVALFDQVTKLSHFLLRGSSIKLIKKAKLRGSFIIGDIVNPHPKTQLSLIQEEYSKQSLRFEYDKYKKIVDREVKELELCDMYFAPSSFVRESYAKNNISNNQIIINPYGVNLNSFNGNRHNKIENESVFRVVCVAQFNLRKGQYYLIEAWKKLNLPNSELILVGLSTDESSYLIRNNRDLFTYYPSIPNYKLKEIFHNSSIFVLPSIYDGFGLVILEAMASGLPVITTENTAGKDIIENGKDGFVVPIANIDKLAETIEKLYLDVSLREYMSTNAIEKSKYYTWESYAKNLNIYYEKILESNFQN